MRSSDCDIIIVPGLGGSGRGHWQTRWETKLSTARRAEQDDWDNPKLEPWVARLLEAVSSATRPVVLVAHSLGVLTVGHAGPLLACDPVRGAFLVAPPDVEAVNALPEVAAFAPAPRDPLPFPSLMIASRTDPFCAYAQAEDLAYAWGSAIVDAGDAGHLNEGSGFGPWPEGLMRFGGFLAKL